MRKYLIYLLILIIALLSVTSTVLAYPHDLADDGWDAYDPTTWDQCGHGAPYAGTSCDICGESYNVSCWVHACTAMLVKVGARPHGYTAMDFHKEADAIGAHAWDGIYRHTIYKMAPDHLEQIKEFSCNYESNSKELARKLIELGVNEGKVIAHLWYCGGTTTAHFVLVDYVETDTLRIKIVDSGRKATYADEYTKDNVQMVYYWGVKDPSNVETLYDWDGKRNTTNRDGTSTLDSAYVLLSEEELEGIRKTISWSELQSLPLVGDDFSLYKEEQMTLAQLEELIASRDRRNLNWYMRMGTVIVGIVLIIFAVLRVCAFFIDSHLGTRFYRFLSYGRYADDSENVDGRRAESITSCFFKSAIIAVLGILLTSGALVNWVKMLIK